MHIEVRQGRSECSGFNHCLQLTQLLERQAVLICDQPGISIVRSH
jgi:hypothetical protein